MVAAGGRSLRLVLGIALGAALLVPAAPAGAQGAREEPKLALVIGNAAYKEAPLRNPTNDARAMASTLRQLGYAVLAHENATKREMEKAIVEFGHRLASGGVGFFFYAGHGLQVRGRNYLVPVDADIDSEASTRIAAVDLDLVLEQMAEARNRVNVVVLDACRNNPFERRLRGASRGLAAVDAARGTLIAYATAPGSVAADGEGSNGLYTEELLKAMRVPGLKVEEVFKQVRIGVMNRSKGAQTPWESSSLTGDLVVNASVKATPPPTAAPAAVVASKKTGERDVAGNVAVAATTGAARFDGVWLVTVQCPTSHGADGYTIRFLASVKDGALRGQHGSEGQPDSLTLLGRIHDDGRADIEGHGVTGAPRFAVNSVPRGTPYTYRATGLFDGTRGTGKRIELRPCELTFFKQ